MDTHHPTPRSPPTTPPTTTRVPSYASIPYSSTFTDDLMTRMLEPGTESPYRNTKPRTGIHILPSTATQTASSGSGGRIEVPLSSIQETSIPVIETEYLPISLSDSRRIYTSAIPGVLLTHPGGYYEGGPCVDAGIPAPASFAPQSPSQARPLDSPQSMPSTYATFVQNFLARYPHVTTASELQRAVREETESQLEMLRMRMREREEGKARNADVERRLEDLVAEREVERRVEERWNRGER